MNIPHKVANNLRQAAGRRLTRQLDAHAIGERCERGAKDVSDIAIRYDCIVAFDLDAAEQCILNEKSFDARKIAILELRTIGKTANAASVGEKRAISIDDASILHSVACILHFSAVIIAISPGLKCGNATLLVAELTAICEGRKRTGHGCC